MGTLVVNPARAGAHTDVVGAPRIQIISVYCAKCHRELIALFSADGHRADPAWHLRKQGARPVGGGRWRCDRCPGPGKRRRRR